MTKLSSAKENLWVQRQRCIAKTENRFDSPGEARPFSGLKG
ncbi:hypothetical protein [Arthrobacter sp. HMWF013]|nr:hypothetical protein [Arthrobacter sp. HMWF013]